MRLSSRVSATGPATPQKRLSRALAVLAAACAGPLVVMACSKPAPAVIDAAPPPVVELPDTGPVVLAPLDDDASFDAGMEAAAPKKAGSGLSTNQARAKQCCNAIRTEAKSLGASPEANILTAFAVQCDSIAMAVGPTAGAQAPELAPLRAFLKGKTVPPICQGL